ncbi:MAG TPA: hypothetical protein VMW91_11270, partial [Desulfosporosinus sp.]|nr:hypothetical protein [Desulfosporosinus sp.]
ELKNIILKYTQENTDAELGMYIQMAMSFLESIPPYIIAFDYGSFPIPSLLIHQAAIECMISNGIMHARNELTYNNGGLTVKIFDGQRYLNFINALLRLTDFEIRNLTNLKISVNLNGAFGGVYSPYASLHGSSQTLNPNSILSG